MAINLKNTGDIEDRGLKVLVYGQAGVGKTTLIRTLPKPIVLSAEAGLLSLRAAKLSYIEIDCVETLHEAYSWLADSEDGQAYESIAIDSVSEVAEVLLSAEKKNTKDPRQAYGEMGDQMCEVIRAFRDMPGKRNIYVTAKVEKTQDEGGRLLYAPQAPGKILPSALPHFFDEVFALRTEKDQDGNVQRALMTESDGLWTAKDRSGKLDAWETADLGEIIRKVSA